MQIFELFGSILLKDPGIEGQLDKIDKKASGTSKGMGLSFGSIASAALKLGAIIGAGLGIKEMMDTAIKGQDRLAQMDAVLTSTKGAAGMTKDELIKLADAQSKLSLNSKGANMETENLLLTFTSIGKDVFPQALTTVNDMSQALGQDTKSSAIQLGKALQDPIKGVTALSRVGVNFTVEQKEQIKTMVASGDTMGAQKVILAELGKEFGGSALSASKTFDGQMTILKNSLKGMGGSIATTVLPYLTQFATWVNAHMPEIQKFISDAMKVIGDAFKSVADFVKENIIPIFKEFYEWIKPHIPEIKQFVSDTFTKIKEVLKVVGDFVKEHVIPAFKDLKEKFDEYWPKIKEAVMKAYDYLKPSFDKLVKAVKEDLMPIIMGLWDTFKKAMPGIQAIFEIVFPILVLAVKTVIDIITDVIKVIKGIYDFIKPGLDKVADLFSTVFGGIKKVIEGVQRVLDIFNGTPMKDKTATVTTSHVTGYDDYGQPIYGKNAAGTDNWRGGLTRVNELGGEIVDLPRGTRIIPHDVSMEMAKNSGGRSTTQNTVNVAQLIVREEADIQKVAQQLFILLQSKSRGLGVVAT